MWMRQPTESSAERMLDTTETYQSASRPKGFSIISELIGKMSAIKTLRRLEIFVCFRAMARLSVHIVIQLKMKINAWIRMAGMAMLSSSCVPSGRYSLTKNSEKKNETQKAKMPMMMPVEKMLPSR